MADKHQTGARGGMAGGNNIEALREAKGWSRPTLGKKMGTSGQQVERLEKGQRKLTHEWMEKAATALGVQPTDIIAPGRPAPMADEPDALPTRDASLTDDTVEITAIDLSFSMGPGATIDDYIEETPVRFDPGFLRAITRSAHRRLRLARGVGESMFPTLSSGDQVLIDTTQRQLNMQDRIWAISLYGAAAIKRLRAIGPTRVLIISDNRDVENQEVDAEDLTIAGRVIWFGREL